MVKDLVKYVQDEADCDEAKAEEIALSIMDEVDDMIRYRMEDDYDN